MIATVKESPVTASSRSKRFAITIILGMFLMMGFWVAKDFVKGYRYDLTKMWDAKYAEAGGRSKVMKTDSKPAGNKSADSKSADVVEQTTDIRIAVKSVADATRPPPQTPPQTSPPTLAPFDKPTTAIMTNAPTDKPTIPPDDLELKEFFAHIPKAGGYYAFRMLQMFLDAEPTVQKQLKNRNKLPRNQRHKVAVDTYCNEGVQHYLGNFKIRNHHDRTCTMHMDEVWPQYNKGDTRYFPRTEIKHKYTIVRDPLSHVLSMWFHCTESRDHANRAHLMPSTLDDWLQAWADARHNKTQYKQNAKFQCYHPLDFQANYIQYDEAKGRGKDFLKANFDLLGDFGRLQKSICAIYIKNRGYIPKECNCTNRRRRLQFEQLDKESHGVTHHGSSFNATDAQRSLILEQIRSTETKMYGIVQEIFDEQVAELEQKHRFVMCETFREYDKGD